MGGSTGNIKNEGEKSLKKNLRYCQLCLRSECKWFHMCVCSPFEVKTNKVCNLS